MFRMLEPGVLSLLFLVPVFWGVYLWAFVGKKGWLKAYGGQVEPRNETIRMVLLSLAVVCAVLGLARLQRLKMGEECVRPGIDIVYGVDVSVSMLAEDTQFPVPPMDGRPPNRLERVRQELLEITDRLHGERVGLFVFASDSSPILPPSPDYENLRFFGEYYLNPWNLSARGTNLLSALEEGAGMLDTEAKYKVLILFTDGEHERVEQIGAVLARARELRVNSDICIYTVGVGSSGYSPIPMRGADGKIEGYLQNSEKELVKTSMERSLLEQIAHGAGGRPYVLGDEYISQQIVADILRGAAHIPFLTRPAMHAQDLAPYFYIAAVVLLVALELAEGLRRFRLPRLGRPVLPPLGSSSRRHFPWPSRHARSNLSAHSRLQK